MSTDDKLLQELREATAEMKKQEEPKEDIKADVTEIETPEVTQEETKEERVYTELEQEQINEGWDPNGSKSAEQFKHDGSFFKKIKEQKKEIQELKDAFRNMTSHQKKLEKVAYEKAVQDLRMERNAAVEVGDVERVEALEQHIDRTKEQLKAIQQEEQAIQTAPERQEPIPAAVDFQERNKTWFRVDLLQKDPSTLEGNDLKAFEMTQEALGYDDDIGMKIKNGDMNISPEQAIKMVEDRIKKLYPETFQKENPNKESAPAVGRSTASSSGDGGSMKLVSRMTEHQKNVYQMYVRADKNFGSIEDFAKQLDAIGDLKKN